MYMTVVTVFVILAYIAYADCEDRRDLATGCIGAILETIIKLIYDRRNETTLNPIMRIM